MSRFPANYARKPALKEEKTMEKKPTTWQRRGLFALVSRRLPPDLPPDPEDDEEPDEQER